MAPIFKGDKEILDGQLKLGNQDVKEVYLGTQKIWPTKIIYPDPVERFFWKYQGPNDAYAIGLLGSASHSFTRRPTVPGASPDNLDASKSKTSTNISGNIACQFQQNVYRVDTTRSYRWQGGKAKFTFNMKKWNLIDTDFNCRLKFVALNLRFSPEHLWGNSAVYSDVYFDGHRIAQCESVYTSPNTINIITWTGTTGFGEKTWVSEKTVGEYFEENNGLVDVDIFWAVDKDGTPDVATRYARADRENASYIRFDFDEISFTTETPESKALVIYEHNVSPVPVPNTSSGTFDFGNGYKLYWVCNWTHNSPNLTDPVYGLKNTSNFADSNDKMAVVYVIGKSMPITYNGSRVTPLVYLDDPNFPEEHKKLFAENKVKGFKITVHRWHDMSRNPGHEIYDRRTNWTGDINQQYNGGTQTGGKADGIVLTPVGEMNIGNANTAPVPGDWLTNINYSPFAATYNPRDPNISKPSGEAGQGWFWAIKKVELVL